MPWWLGCILCTGCLMSPGPSIRARLDHVVPPAVVGPEVLVWDGWHPIDVSGELRDRLVVAHQLAEEGYRFAALDFLGALVRVHPESAPLHEARGVLQAASGFPRAAEREFERALEGGRECPELWYALGRVRLALHLPTAALESLRRAEELGADGWRLHRDIARAQRALGRWPRAVERYDWAIACRGGGRPDLLLEAAGLPLDRWAPRLPESVWAQAITYARKAELLAPADPHPCFVRGLICEKSGDLGRAIAAYEDALQRDSAFLPALVNLAVAARRLDDETRVALAARRALVLERDQERREMLENLLAADSDSLARRD